MSDRYSIHTAPSTRACAIIMHTNRIVSVLLALAGSISAQATVQQTCTAGCDPVETYKEFKSPGFYRYTTTTLSPYPVTEVNPTAADLALLRTTFPPLPPPRVGGWSFTASPNTLSAGAIKIPQYKAVATSTSVGADIVATYTPAGTDPTNVHWVQIITTNHPGPMGGGGGHGTTATYVDQLAPGRLYYDFGGLATGGPLPPSGSHYLVDKPRRPDIWEEHDWEAKTFLVVGPPAGTAGPVTILKPGFRWGWKNRVTQYVGPPRLYKLASLDTPMDVVASTTLAPSTTTTASMTSAPAQISVEQNSQTSVLQITSASLDLDIGPAEDSTWSVGGGRSLCTITDGSGTIDPVPVGGESATNGMFPFVFEDGEAYINWETNEVSFRADTRVTALGQLDVYMRVFGQGTLNPATNTVTFDAMSFSGTEGDEAGVVGLSAQCPKSQNGPDLSFANAPVLGESFTIQGTGLVSSQNGGLVCGVMVGIEMAPAPIGSSEPGSQLCIDQGVDMGCFFPDPFGNYAELTLTTPNDPNLLGLELASQWINVVGTAIRTSAVGNYRIGAF